MVTSLVHDLHARDLESTRRELNGLRGRQWIDQHDGALSPSVRCRTGINARRHVRDGHGLAEFAQHIEHHIDVIGLAKTMRIRLEERSEPSTSRLRIVDFRIIHRTVLQHRQYGSDVRRLLGAAQGLKRRPARTREPLVQRHLRPAETKCIQRPPAVDDLRRNVFRRVIAVEGKEVERHLPRLRGRKKIR